MVQAEFLCHRQVKEAYQMIRKYLPGFENCQLVSIMPYTGVRESRRLVGKKKLTLQDVLALNIPEDTVAIAGYNRDTHSPVSYTHLFDKFRILCIFYSGKHMLSTAFP